MAKNKNKKKNMSEKKNYEQPSEEQLAENEQAAVNEENVQEETAEQAAQPEAEPTEEEKLKASLADAEVKLAELNDRYLRQMAEFENYRKRTLKEKSELILNGSANLMKAVLPVLDDMARALDSMEKTNDAEACCEGFKLITRNFHTILEQNGLKAIETKGQAFDTDFHEAVALLPATDEAPKGTIIDCIQTGYKLNDKVLRHAKVVVAD